MKVIAIIKYTFFMAGSDAILPPKQKLEVYPPRLA
jgi:hypothetical protein